MRNCFLKQLLLISVVLLWSSTVSAQIEKTFVHEGLETQSSNFESAIFLQAGKQVAALKGGQLVIWEFETAEVLREKKIEGENLVWDTAGESIIYRAYNGEKYGLNVCQLADLKVTALPIYDDWVPVSISQTGRLLCHRDNQSRTEYQVFALPGGKPLLPETKLIKPGKDVNGTNVSISPNGGLVAVCYSREEDAIRLFDLEEKKWTVTSQGYLARAGLPHFSPDSRSLAVQCQIAGNNCIAVLNASSLQPVGKPLPQANKFLCLPDNRRILILEDTPGLYDISNNQLLSRFYGMSYYYEPAFTSDGLHLVIPSAEAGKLNVWDWQRQLRFQAPEQTWSTHRASPKDKYSSNRKLEVTYHPSGKQVAIAVGALQAEGSGGSVGLSVAAATLDEVADGKVITGKEFQDTGKISSAYFLILDTSTGLLKSIGTPAELTSDNRQLDGKYFTSLQFSPDGKQFCTLFGYDGHLTLWDVARKQARPTFLLAADGQDFRREWNSVSFAKEGTQLHIVSRDQESGLQVFDLPQRRMIKRQPLGSNYNSNITVVNDRQIAVGLSIWNRQDYSEEFKSNHSDAYSFRTKKVSDRGVAGFYGREIVLFDLESRRIKSPFIAHDKNGIKTDGFAVSHDGRLLATACEDQLIRVWEIGTGQLLVNLKGHQSWIGSLDFSPDDSMLASISNDGTTRFWNTKGLATGTATVVKPNLPTHAEFPVGSDGKVVVSFERSATQEEIVTALEAALEAARSQKDR